ncbi:importin-like protein [Phytophthora cinnamomi]|uniref:importin-like protein n=1 Tax=Phytophthora cinnamomi TaxID=4785 RepID=UPI00355A813F|nr:importin-like protein [Phytophthora cinnamomi]
MIRTANNTDCVGSEGVPWGGLPEESVEKKTYNTIKAMSARIDPVVMMDHMFELMRLTKAVCVHEHVCQVVDEE